jgi:hypothetical protein
MFTPPTPPFGPFSCWWSEEPPSGGWPFSLYPRPTGARPAAAEEGRPPTLQVQDSMELDSRLARSQLRRSAVNDFGTGRTREGKRMVEEERSTGGTFSRPSTTGAVGSHRGGGGGGGAPPACFAVGRMWSSPRKMKTWLGVDSGISSSSTAVVSDLLHLHRRRRRARALPTAAPRANPAAAAGHLPPSRLGTRWRPPELRRRDGSAGARARTARKVHGRAEAEAAAGAVGFQLGARKILGREDVWGRRRNKSPMNWSHMSYQSRGLSNRCSCRSWVQIIGPKKVGRAPIQQLGAMK